MNPSVPIQAHEKLSARMAALGIPRHSANALLERHMIVRYPRGAELFAKGSPADVIFVVLSGVVKVTSTHGGADRVLVDLAGVGDICGYADFADAGGTRSQLFSAHALTNCCVALLTRQHIAEVMKSLDMTTVMRIAEGINSAWSQVAFRYASFLGMSLRARLETVLRELASRFGVPDARGTLLLPELAQEDLAEMIGSSRPMVSKLLSDMAGSGELIREGRRHILVQPVKPAAPLPLHGNGTGHGKSIVPPPINGAARAMRVSSSV